MGHTSGVVCVGEGRGEVVVGHTLCPVLYAGEGCGGTLNKWYGVHTFVVKVPPASGS